MTSRYLPVSAIFAAVAFPASAAVDISSAPTSHMSCASGVCTPTAKKAVLNVDDLRAMLASGNVVVNTGAGAVTLEVTAPFSWAGTHTLTLNADYNVSVKAQIVVQGAGGFAVNANQGHTDGEFRFFPGGKIDFWDMSASLVVAGDSFTLVDSVPALAAAIASNKPGKFALARDYDAGPDGTYNGHAVSAPFEGTFDGLGHAISNISIAGSVSSVGFFADLDNCRLNNLTLKNVDIAGGEDTNVGALAGSTAGCIITNAHSSGHVSAGSHSEAGGLSGGDGAFYRSDSSATVTAGQRSSAGGLVGAGGGIHFSHATGSVTVGSGSAGGGLSGAGAVIEQSYATGDVISVRLSRRAALGGLVGAVYGSTISNSYAMGAIHNQGPSKLGGLIGYSLRNNIVSSYATGAVGVGGAGLNDYGGVVGYPQHITYQDLYWDVDTSGMSVPCTGNVRDNTCRHMKGLSDVELKSRLPRGFSPAIWGQDPAINNGYPYLLNNPPE